MRVEAQHGCEHEPKLCKGLCKSCYMHIWRQKPVNVRKQATLRRKWYLANRDTILAKNRERYASDPAERQKAATRAKASSLANPGRTRLLRIQTERNRRARKSGSNGSFTPAEWQTLKQQYGNRCVGCWRHETELKALGRVLSPDVVPLSKGGLNHITNLQPLCHGLGGCNNKKHAHEFDFLVS